MDHKIMIFDLQGLQEGEKNPQQDNDSTYCWGNIGLPAGSLNF